MSRYVSLIALLGVLSLVAGVFIRVMSSFVLPLFLAALLFVVFRPLHAWIVKKCGGRNALAAGLSTSAILLIVLGPVAWFSAQAGLEAFDLLATFDRQALAERLVRVRETVGLQLPRQYEKDLTRLDAAMRALERSPAAGGTGEGRSEQLAERAAVALAAAEPLERAMRSRYAGGPRDDDQPEEGAKADDAKSPDAKSDDAGSNAAETTLGGPSRQSAPPGGDEAAEAGNTAEAADEATAPASDRPAAPFAWSSGLIPALQGIRDAEEREGQLLALADARAGYRVLRQEVLGGPLKAWMIDWTNPSEEMLSQARDQLLSFVEKTSGPLAIDTTKSLIGFVIGLLVMTVTLFFMFSDGPAMFEGVISISPLEEEHVRRLLSDFDRVTRGVVAATLLSAAAQGLLAGVGYYFVGFKATLLLAALTGVLAMVPFVGAGAVWLPCSLWLFLAEDRWLAGGLLALYGTTVVSLADNVIKPLVLHGQSKLHPLLALLSVLGGVQALGPVGIFVGPMAVAFLHSVLQILRVEVSRIEKSREGAAEGQTAEGGGDESEGTPPKQKASVKRNRWQRRK